MATININKREVVRKKRNGRADESTSFLASSSFATGGTIIDWAEVTPDLITINRDLHVTGNITASEDVIAYVAGAVTSDVLDVLSVSNPLEKTGTNISLKVNSTQLEVNTSNELQIKAGVLTPAEHIHTISDVTGLQTALDSKLSTAIKGTANGLAELDANGFVKNAQLPSYVDDVLEYSSFDALPVTGENGKIYITTDNNKTFRWSGSVYAEISSSIALGETSSTAYRGDRGKTAYDHSQVVHDKTLVGLSNVDNTSDLNKPVSTAQQTALILKVDKVAGKSLVNDTDIAKLTPISVTASKVTIDRDLHVEGNITASADVVAYVAGAVTSNVLDALSVSSPLQKTGTNIQLNLNPAQFNIVGNQLNYIGSTGLSSVSWNDVTSKPAFSTVATSGSYTDLINKPNLFSGSYTDLTDKPVITSTIAGSTDVNTYFTGTKAITAAYADSAGNSNTLDSISSGNFAKSYFLGQANIDTQRADGFYEFDPVPTGVPPITSPNIRILSIGRGGRNTQMAFNYSSNRVWFRRNTDGVWSLWNEFYHDGNLNKSVLGLGNVDNTADANKSVNYASSAGNSDTVDGLHKDSFLRCDSTSSGNPLNGNFAVGSASGRNFIQSHSGQPLDLNPLGNTVTINGNTVWTGGNFTPDNYLLKSGGTLSGKVLMKSAYDAEYGGAIEIRERDYVAHNQSDWNYSPALSFHWANRAVVRFGLRADGQLAVNNTPISLLGHTHDYATHRGEGTNFVDYSRYVYNNGAYSGSGWIEPSDLGVRYAASAGNADTVDGIHTDYIVYGDGGSTYGKKTKRAYNLNDGMPSGFYDVSNGENSPTSNTWYHLLNIAHTGSYDGNRYQFQMAAEFWNNEVYTRAVSAGNAGGWNRLWHSGNTNKTDVDWTARTLFLSNSGSGAELLRFNTERPWNFTQYNSGAATELRLNDLNGSKIFRIVDTGNGGNVAFNNGSVTASGEVTAYSDKRLKADIKPLTVRGDLKPVTYIKEGKESIGFIAQEVKEVYPELVAGDESKEMLSLNYQQLTAVLYAEILELKERIKKLEGENK